MKIIIFLNDSNTRIDPDATVKQAISVACYGRWFGLGRAHVRTMIGNCLGGVPGFASSSRIDNALADMLAAGDVVTCNNSTFRFVGNINQFSEWGQTKNMCINLKGQCAKSLIRAASNPKGAAQLHAIFTVGEGPIRYRASLYPLHGEIEENTLYYDDFSSAEAAFNNFVTNSLETTFTPSSEEESALHDPCLAAYSSDRRATQLRARFYLGWERPTYAVYNTPSGGTQKIELYANIDAAAAAYELIIKGGN